MLIHNADITGSLTINGVPYNTGSYTGIFKSGTNIMSANTVSLTGSFTGSFFGDGSQLSGVTSYTNADTLSFIQGYSGSYSGSFSGSFFGDGSNLSGVTSYTDADTLDFINSLNVVSGSIQTVSTVSDTFTSATSYTVTHNFGTKQVIVSVYENDILIFPSSITTPTTNTVTITFPEPVTGRVVVVKAGHIVSGSINYNSVLNKPTLVSGSSQISFTGISNKPTLVSGSSQITYSGLTGIPSGIVSGSSQISFTGITNKPTLISGSSQIAALGYATTGSNQFNGNQSITGSLTVSGQVVAQTLNVQQVTSSVVFSSGSNIFGNNTGNTHQFTGSVNISGSLTTSIATLGTAATTFLTSDNGTIKSRTAAQTLSDIGGQATGSYVTVATNQSITGQKTFTKNIDVNGVYVGRGASSGDLFGGISGNTAIGSQALLSISTGYPNTAVGAEALRNITTGANNIAVGSTAGKLISAGTANETSTTSIYIGNDTRPSANGNTNEIVIGHTTTGNGSNTVTIGNSSITNTYLKGAVTLTGALNGTSASFKVNADRNLAIKYDTNITISGQADSGGPESLRIYADTFRIYTATTAVGLTERFTISNSGNIGIGAPSPGNLLALEKSSNSGSGSTFPRIKVMNTLATQGDGTSTFNFADIMISAGNEAVNMFLATTYAAGTWAPAGIINVSTNHDLQFKTNNTTRLTLANSGAATFNSSVTTTSSASGTAPQLKLQNPVDSNSSQGAANNLSAGQLLFGAIGSFPLTARIESVYNSDASFGRSADLVFSGANGSGTLSERMRIGTDGYIRLDATTGGIQFNGDTAAANALDDYEEGSFTPSSLGTDFSSISVVFGRYIKIGNQVTINCRWTVTPGSTGMKYVVFDLPFAFVNNSNIAFTGAVSNYNEGQTAGSSNVGTTTRNSSGSTSQQYVQAYYTSTNVSTLLLSMTYFTFF